MTIVRILSIFLISFSLQAQSLTFGPATTLFNLDAAHWTLSQPMIPTVSIDGKHVDFYGLTGSTYKKHTYTAGSYLATPFQLYGDFNYIIDVLDFDGDGEDDILTDYDIFKNKGNNVYERFPFGNISYVVEGSLDYDGDGLRDVVITEKDFSSSLTSIYIFKNKGNFVFEKIIVEQNKRRVSTIIFADVDGDLRDDIITANNSDANPFTVIFSNANGTFTARDIKGNNKYFLSHTLSAVDMDKDGDLDIVVMDYEKGLWFFKNTDNYQTTTRLNDSSFDLISNGLFVHCDDLNGDGWPDFVVGKLTETKLTMQVSKGTGPFQFDDLKEIGFVQGGTSDFAPLGRAITRMLHTVDINNDGKKDIVMTSTFDKKQVAWVNNSIISSSSDVLLADVTIYPNPSNDFLYIQSEVQLSFSIFSVDGCLQMSGNIDPTDRINLNILPPATYIIELFDNNDYRKVQKFIKH